MTVCQTVSRSTRSYSWRRKLPIPLMFRHGMPGQRVSATSPSRIAASLIFCRCRSTAAMRIGSSRKRSNETPAMNSSILLIEFKMSCRDWSGVLEDKLGLTVEVALHVFLQAIGVT